MHPPKLSYLKPIAQGYPNKTHLFVPSLRYPSMQELQLGANYLSA